MKLFNTFLKAVLYLTLPNEAIFFNPIRPNSFEQLYSAKHEKKLSNFHYKND
jgi:hypothetical protein